MIRNSCTIFLFAYLGIATVTGQRSIQAFELPIPISVDGIHEPDKWIGADSAISYIQMEPTPGGSASQPTIAYIGYDSDNLYVSVNLYQDAAILAKVMNRDVLTKGDDSFVLVIDPYNDNRSGYGFWTNPLSTQTDFRINDDGRNIDVNWDTQWKTSSVVHREGWTLEMSIPFNSIQCNPE